VDSVETGAGAGSGGATTTGVGSGAGAGAAAFLAGVRLAPLDLAEVDFFEAGIL
tara:strand:+ start:72 stop:233 length:162 start_codon:yes stop_codon:yes gene_type:complete